MNPTIFALNCPTPQGFGGYGNLGQGSAGNSGKPVAVAGGMAFAAIIAGSFYTCGLTSSGEMYCWGGLIANATLPYVNIPTKVPGDHKFVALGAGDYHACALDTSGRAWCLGAHQQ